MNKGEELNKTGSQKCGRFKKNMIDEKNSFFNIEIYENLLFNFQR